MELIDIVKNRLQAVNHAIQLIKGGSNTGNTLDALIVQKELLEGLLDQHTNQSIKIK